MTQAITYKSEMSMRKKGYHIPEQWQFSRDIEAMLRVKFWDD
ncbi:hypothetical protein [Phormidium tenue]|jgi:hypothetical protein|nr:hypothetical protein [Phormidium tenue]